MMAAHHHHHHSGGGGGAAAEESWDAIPSIDCVDEHLQDSFDFYSVRVEGVGRRVKREDLSKLVWSVTRVAVSQARCVEIVEVLREEKGSEDMQHLTISQCERVIREIEMQECDKFLSAAEAYLDKTRAADKAAAEVRRSSQGARVLRCCPCLAPADKPPPSEPPSRGRAAPHRTSPLAE